MIFAKAFEICTSKAFNNSRWFFAKALNFNNQNLLTTFAKAFRSSKAFINFWWLSQKVLVIKAQKLEIQKSHQSECVEQTFLIKKDASMIWNRKVKFKSSINKLFPDNIKLIWPPKTHSKKNLYFFSTAFTPTHRSYEFDEKLSKRCFVLTMSAEKWHSWRLSGEICFIA